MTNTWIDPDSTDIDECLAMLVRAMSAANELHFSISYPSFEPCTFGIDKGKKYSRVWVKNWNRAPYCSGCVRLNQENQAKGTWTPVVCRHEKPVVEGQQFVCFFVERSNGDVWKAGGYKKPALNFTRGNIIGKVNRRDFILNKIDAETGRFYHGIA